jgi:hypothetical protein
MTTMDKNGELIGNIILTIFLSVCATIAAFLINSDPSILRTLLGIIVLFNFSAAFIILCVNWWVYAQEELPGQRSRKEYLLIGYDAIPWSNIDHISLRKSEVGNMYAAIYFKNDRPPKGFNIENIKDKETFIDYLKENASKKGYIFEIK